MTEPRDNIPAAVETTRIAIIDAAMDCDYEALAAIASRSPGGFEAGVPAETDLEAHWSSEEAAGSEPLRFLVLLMRGSIGTVARDDTNYYFPSASSFGTWEEVPGAGQRVLLDIYPQTSLDAFEDAGVYTGDSALIDNDGNWVSFIRGDF